MSAVGTIVPDDPHITHAIVSDEPSHGTAAWFLYAHGYIIFDDADISYMIEEATLDSNKATIQGVVAMLSDPGPGALAGEYQSIFTSQVRGGIQREPEARDWYIVWRRYPDY